jgi:hypothetical protein
LGNLILDEERNDEKPGKICKEEKARSECWEDESDGVQQEKEWRK